MRPAFRIVPAALAALVVALALTSSAQPHRSPPTPPKRAHTVSTAVPYVAPWQSGFEKFATQLYTPTISFGFTLKMTIPDGQWWRIIYLLAQASTDPTAGKRTMDLNIKDAHGTDIFNQLAPAYQPASTTVQYLFGPGLTSYAFSDPTAFGQATAGTPDLLWPPGSVVSLLFGGNTGVADQLDSPRTFAVEIYTEQRGVLVPEKLTPTPLIS